MINLFKRKQIEISNPSKDFQDFLNDYFTGHPMIRGRGEEDITVWERLKNDELEAAKEMVLSELDKKRDTSYIRAAGIFRDKRAVKKLNRLIRRSKADRYCYERLLAAKVLFDWVGYSNYFKILDNALSTGGQLIKIHIRNWIKGLNKTDALKYIFLLLRDNDSFARWSAYGALKEYLNNGQQEYEETKYYTADEVFSNKELFESRLQELNMKIKNW